MSKPIKIHVVRLTREQIAKIVIILIQAGEFELANKILAQASK